MDVRRKKIGFFNSTLLLAAFLLASVVHAEGEDLNSVSLEDLLNIKVTTASKIEQKQSEAPGILTVLKREQFKEYGWYSLNDALYHQAGFFPSRDYDRRTVGSRGLYEGWNNNHLLLLIDGVPFNDPMYGTAYTSEITPIFFMKNVEILRGPGSALYGSNATNGVIAMNTYSGSDLAGKPEASMRAGSYNTTEWNVMTGNAHGKLSYVIGASGSQTAGLSYESYDASGRTTAGGSPVKERVRDDRSNRYLFFKAEGQENLKGLSFEFHDQQWHYQTGHGWLFAIPDQADIMSEYRQVATMSYKPQSEGKLSTEFTLKYEHKENDWYTRYQPDGGIGYADGVTEYLDFAFDHYFGRAQTSWDFGSKAALLAGLEASAFLYKGDRVHLANTDMSTFLPTTGNKMVKAPNALGLITDKPIVNVGAYTQVTTGDWLGLFKGTAGLRFDNETVHFNQALATPVGTGNGTRTFNQLSPRLAGVFVLSDDLSFKVLLGRAFRAPAPSELAGVNTWALANNIRNLKPEIVTTGEVGAEYRVNKAFSAKGNVFVTEVKDQIGYNASGGNLSTNIYTTKTMGVESELNYINGSRSGFFNVSYASRLDESIADTTVSASKTKVTWAPSLTANLGALREITPELKVAAVLQYMSEVKRRTSDTLTVANTDLRGGSIPAWYGLDTNVSYKLTKDDQLDVAVRNIFDKRSHLIKNRDYNFDYQVEGINYYTTYTHYF